MKPLDPQLLRYARPVRGLVVGAVALGVAGAVATVVQAFLLGSVLAGAVVGGAGLAQLSTPLCALAATVVARSGIAWASEELAQAAAVRASDDLRRSVLRTAAALGPRWRSHEQGAGLVPLLTSGLDGLQEYLARYVPALVLAALVPPAVVVVLWWVDPTSGLIVLVTLPLVPVFMALVGWYTDRATAAKWAKLQALSSHFSEVVAGLETLLVFGRARGQARAVRRRTEEHRVASMATLRIAFLSSMVLELLSTLSVALVAVTVGLRLVTGSMQLGPALTVLILAPEAYLPLRTLGARFHAAADGAGAVDRLLRVLRLPVVHPDRPAPDLAGRPPALQLTGVTVDLGEGRGLRNLDVRVAAGTCTVLQGPSGVGKTTVLRVLAGLLLPDAGQVIVTTPTGQTDLARTDAAGWRSRISWCSQQPVLVPGTIRENLLLGHPRPDGMTEQQVRQALRAAAAEDVVAGLADGLDAEIGDDGLGLSVGQLRRLCLARAVLRSAPVVLLDEPTAGLDTRTEQRVLAGLAEHLAGRTVVLATHRAGPLAWADQVVQLSERPLPAGDAPMAGDAPTVPAAQTSGALLAKAGVNPW